MAMRRIGQILVDLGFITDDQLEMLLEEQQQQPGDAARARSPMSMGLITDEQLAQALAEQMGMQVVSLADMVIPPDVLEHGHRADGPDVPHRSDRASATTR